MSVESHVFIEGVNCWTGDVPLVIVMSIIFDSKHKCREKPTDIV